MVTGITGFSTPREVKKKCHVEFITSKLSFRHKTFSCVAKCIIRYFFALRLCLLQKRNTQCKKKSAQYFANSFYAEFVSHCFLGDFAKWRKAQHVGA